MENLQAFVDNLIAYDIIFTKTKKLKYPMEALRRGYDLENLLKEKATLTKTKDLTTLNIDEKSIKVLSNFENDFSTLPLLIAYYHVNALFSGRDFGHTDALKTILTKHNFNYNELWLLYDVVDKIRLLKHACGWTVFLLEFTIHENKIKKTILDFIKDESSRKAYEKAKLLLKEEA